MITIGGTNIVKAYLGSTELTNIAIGDELLLSNEPKNYLALEAIEAGTFSFTNNVEYSLDGNSWTELAANTSTPEIAAGGIVYWRGEITPKNGTGSGTFSSSRAFNAFGNPLSLNYGSHFDGINIYSSFAYMYLFSNSKIVSAENMDLSHGLSSYCFQGMFASSSLSKAPVLPALTLVAGCYNQMFRYCSNLNYIKSLFTTDISTGSSYTYAWVQGVSKSGTFVKNTNATWSRKDNNSIPVNWTIEYAVN
jgi:hypothetical protein